QHFPVRGTHSNDESRPRRRARRNETRGGVRTLQHAQSRGEIICSRLPRDPLSSSLRDGLPRNAALSLPLIRAAKRADIHRPVASLRHPGAPARGNLHSPAVFHNVSTGCFEYFSGWVSHLQTCLVPSPP